MYRCNFDQKIPYNLEKGRNCFRDYWRGPLKKTKTGQNLEIMGCEGATGTPTHTHTQMQQIDPGYLFQSQMAGIGTLALLIITYMVLLCWLTLKGPEHIN
jgi:hypothetical protein